MNKPSTSAQQNIPDSLILFLGQLAALRDPHTWAHSLRVGEITVALAGQIDYPQLRINVLKQAAFLHDIGKVAIPEAIINKPGKLNSVEYEVVQQHPVLGHKLIQILGLAQEIENAVLYHHENYDGSGYPYGLSRDEIPLEARIIRIADFYDALISPRTYRGPYPPSNALQIMRQNKKCFDPVLFEAFQNL